MGLVHRLNFIIEKAKGKRVLHLGCVGRADVLHKEIESVAKDLTGIDIDRIGIQRLREKGYSVIEHDVEKPFDLEPNFDLIVAGELLEHLGNPLRFLTNLHPLMEQGTELIVTVPNVYVWNKAIYYLIKKQDSQSSEHIVGFTKELLRRLLEHANCRILEFHFGYEAKFTARFRAPQFPILRIFPHLAPYLIAVCKIKKKGDDR